MLIREILTESRTDEGPFAPVGMLTRGLTKLGAALGSNKLAGANDMQRMANQLYKDIEKWMGKSGIRQTDADSLLASPLFQGDRVMPDILQKLGADQGIIPANKLKQAVLAYAKEYNKTGGTVAQQQQGPAADTAAPEADPVATAKAKMAKDVEVVNMEPMILRYRGKDYHLGNKGEWVDSKINRPAPEAFQAFLNQQADIADDAAIATPTSTASDPLDRIKANAGVAPAPAPTATKPRAPRKKKPANPAVNPAANSAI
jgi:hypothetical protein